MDPVISPSSGPATGHQRRPGDSGRHFWQRVAFWRALSGVGFTLAIAAVIVAAEFSAALIHRTHWMSRRIAHLNTETRRLRKSAESNAHKLATLKTHAAIDAALKRMLTAPDLRVLRIRPVVAANAVRGKPGSTATAVIVTSDALKSAILQAQDLAPLPKDRVYGVWWIPPHGKPVAAGNFHVGVNHSATARLAMPPSRADSAAIFVQDETASAPPAGTPVLRSAVSGSVRR